MHGASMSDRPGAAAVVVAGGSGSRLGASVNKVYLDVVGQPILARSLAVLATSPQVDAVVLVVRSVDRDAAQRCARGYGGGKVVAIVEGGASRHASERNGLRALEGLSADLPPLTLIHDGARPFLTHVLLASLLAAAETVGGAIPGFAPDEQLYRVDGDSLVPVGRGALRRVQTPQVFPTAALLDAYRAADHAGFDGLDTADTVQRFTDVRVAVVPGDPRNLKVTTPDDLALAESYAACWHDGAWTR